jgi:hypothetical protein
MLVGLCIAQSPLRLLHRFIACGERAQLAAYSMVLEVVPGGGVEPP